MLSPIIRVAGMNRKKIVTELCRYLTSIIVRLRELYTVPDETQ